MAPRRTSGWLQTNVQTASPRITASHCRHTGIPASTTSSTKAISRLVRKANKRMLISRTTVDAYRMGPPTDAVKTCLTNHLLYCAHAYNKQQKTVNSCQTVRFLRWPNSTGHQIAPCLSAVCTFKNLRSEITGTRIVLTTHAKAIVTTVQMFRVIQQTFW